MPDANSKLFPCLKSVNTSDTLRNPRSRHYYFKIRYAMIAYYTNRNNPHKV